jgi:hypothetical protein
MSRDEGGKKLSECAFKVNVIKKYQNTAIALFAYLGFPISYSRGRLPKTSCYACTIIMENVAAELLLPVIPFRTAG